MSAAPIIAVDAPAKIEFEAPPRVDPRHSREWTFELDVTDSRGTQWTGTFTNRILNVGEQQSVHTISARLAGGVPYETLSPAAVRLNEALAHMAVSLAAPDGTFRGPAWARDLRTQDDVALVGAVFDKVVEHENAFFRLQPSQEGGQEVAQNS